MSKAHPVFAALYDLAMTPWERLRVSRTRERLVGDLGGRILEVGVGTGLNLRHYGPQASVFAVEPDPYMLSRAKPRARAVTGSATLVRAVCEALPFQTGSFEAAVACLMLCSVDSPEAALSEVRRCLKTGAKLRFVEHVRAHNRWIAELQRLATPLWSRLCAGCHLDRPTASLISNAGFRIEAINRAVGGLWICGSATAVG
ncbi:MAG: class I SAM-dependent methyltransferase [Deltaproteobacteria bacterium]|jgi:ubiquinone/menaquinone biosynthesis C-methylase UbiE|nr:class I SAM-dependent methyltransferase [Deltaproteobacteria bacterium]